MEINVFLQKIFITDLQHFQFNLQDFVVILEHYLHFIYKYIYTA